MYVHLLSSMLTANATTATTPGELLAQVLVRRAQLLGAVHLADRPPELRLSYDVDYDCALIALCTALDIHTGSACFGEPQKERSRLETALAEAGIDLANADEHRATTPTTRSPRAASTA
jgi:hypothetical protein